MAFDANRGALIREKLTLAQQLVRVLEETRETSLPVTNEALLQGAVALLGEGREAFLVLIGQVYGASFPEERPSLRSLKEQLGEDNGDLQILDSLKHDSDSWWSQLESLLDTQRSVRAGRRQPQQSELIAVAHAGEPSRSPDVIGRLIQGFRRHLEEFTERHHEW